MKTEELRDEVYLICNLPLSMDYKRSRIMKAIQNAKAQWENEAIIRYMEENLEDIL